ncbi:MAG: site-2 protease family protein [Candidatus Marinimicrobia bacterium]|nr:site-2 protease family protein [Candidatus Neomarinimicrobiota bacterium]|tara:strand:+ start:84 stop:743 length:660 start_codon:yes stop_codon:yes gene_type:complete
MGIIRYLESDPTLFVCLVLCLIFSLCFHEYAHGIVAFYLGDDTAYRQGRLTLNPLAHLDPIGSAMILFIGIGYAKPVPVNPYNLSNYRQDMIKIAAAGPVSNLLLSFLGIFTYYLLNPENSSTLAIFLQIFIHINTALAVFNLIPMHPLDGGQIFTNLLSRKFPSFTQNLHLYGPKILLAVIMIGIFTGYSILWMIIGPIVTFIINFFDIIISFIFKIF